MCDENKNEKVCEDKIKDEATEAHESAAEEAPKSEPESSAKESTHDERVAALAARIAALAAKGDEVIASLNKKIDEVDATYGQKAAATNSQVESFAASMQAYLEKAANQFAKDLDVISRSIDEELGSNVAEDKSQEPYVAQFTPAAQAYRDRMQVGSGSDLLLTDPEFVERFANFAFDDVPSDVDLPDRTRFICWLATLLGCQGIDEFRALLPAALNMGVEPEAVKETVYQATAYLGIGRTYPFLKATNDVLTDAGVELPLKPQATTAPTEESRYEGGEQAQVACFGEQMHGYKDRGAADYPHIAQWLVKNCFGDWYTRGGLTIPEREMITFCFIAAQGGCEAQLKAHTAGNVQCGNGRDFLIKVVSNNVPFIGYPRSLNAMAVVEEVTGAKE